MAHGHDAHHDASFSPPNPRRGSRSENAERANRIASSQEQLLHAQLQQLGLESSESPLDAQSEALLPPRHDAWSAAPAQWGTPDLAGASPWGPPPLAPMQYHRRGASDAGGFRFPSSQPSYQPSERPTSPPFAGAPASMEQQRQAIQQQIEQLQRQQQQLLRQQQLMQPALPSLHEEGAGRTPPAHRRIQSHSATSTMPLDPSRAWPRPVGDPQSMRTTPNFSFPPRRAASETHNAQAQEMPQRGGHTRHASYQLATELSPEFLMAGGGMLNLASLGLGAGHGSDLADGFGEAPAPRRPHTRSSSMSSAHVPVPASGDLMASLPQAQAQLAALHRSRLQAGPGVHARSASYSGNRSTSNGSAPRKALFGSYLPQASLAPLLLTGKLVVGILRVNKRNRSDAWVTTEVLDSDIFISGSKDRNRALEGDLVAVELLDPQEVWQTKRDKVDKKKRKEEHAHSAPFANGRRSDKARDDTEVEGAQLKLVEDEEESENAPPALAGHVVAIVERVPGQIFPGTLALLRPSSVATKEKQQAEKGGQDEEREPGPRPKIVWFRPSDKRVPLIAIPADQAPADFWNEAHQESYSRCLFVACIKRWPITSLHPFGTLVDQLGPIGDLSAEAEALVRSHCNALAGEFGDAVLKAVPPASWTVPSQEYATRRTFGATSSPGLEASASDVYAIEGQSEVAISVGDQGGRTLVGVHFADIGYFVRPGSVLDREAKKRGERAVLVDRAYEMLPPALAAHAAGLVQGKDRLAISVVFTLVQNDVQDIWVGKSVVRVAQALSYAALSKAIDASPSLQCASQFATALHAERTAAGALPLDEPRLRFTLKDGRPTDVTTTHPIVDEYEHTLVHELVLRANTAAAHCIASSAPDRALLVRADAPHERVLQTLRAQLVALRIPGSDTLTPQNLPSVLAHAPAEARGVAHALVVKAVPSPRFFCTGMVDISKFGHYTIPAPAYTEISAPFSQYAQIAVHRQLDAALGGTADELDAEAVSKIAQQANARHKAVALAQEQSAHLFLCQLLQPACLGPLKRSAVVMCASEHYIDLLVPSLTVERRVHLDSLALAHVHFDAAHATVSLTWPDGAAQTLAPRGHVDVELHADMEKSPPVLTLTLLRS